MRAKVMCNCRKTKERFRGLSNMCSGYKNIMGWYAIQISESLLQYCKAKRGLEEIGNSNSGIYCRQPGLQM